MKRKLTMILLMAVISIAALAQSTINGTVVSAQDGEPIIGAAIKVKGSSTGSVTDMNGKFSIQAQPGKTLVISYIGMQSKEVSAKNGMLVELSSDENTLDEVMVVAYGTTKKSSFTGAAAVVKGDAIEKLQVSDIGKALEGSVAGVTINSGSNDPGSTASILIRGVGSISASTYPLIVVDGVPYEGSLNSIPSQDIESLTVLKDAAANSMYGARGSNGVIMITTKKGKSGKLSINLDTRLGFNARGVGNYDIVSDPAEYYELTWESIRNSVVDELGSYAAAGQYASNNLISSYLKYNCFKGIADNELIDPQTGMINSNATTRKWSDNWQKDPFSSKLRQEYNINISGGSDKTQGYVSASYLNDKGYVNKSGFERFAARAKVDHTLNSWLSAGLNLSYSQTKKQSFNEGGDQGETYSNIFYFSQAIAPIYPIYFYDNDGNRALNSDGGIYDFGDEYGRAYASASNPVGQLEGSKNSVLVDNFSSRGYLNFTLPYGFKFAANIAYDLFNDRSNYYMTPIGGDAADYGGRGYKYSTRNGALNVNEILDWDHDFDKHNIHIKLGHENKRDDYNYLYGHMTNFADPNNDDFNNATVYQELYSYSTKYTLEGYFSQLEYNYADRYYFTASYRRDGSSRFSKDNRWGDFWAIGASWRAKEEAFLKDVQWLDNLKFKVSYGTQGNDNLPTYSYFFSDLYSVNRVNGDVALSKALRGNSDLTWEKSRNFNIGLESGFLNRLKFNFEFFVKETRDMLYQSPLALSSGTPTYIWRNEMNMKNTGFEFELSADIVKNSQVNWNVALNGTHYKNKLTKLPATKTDPAGYQDGYYWRKLGGSLYDWYLYEYMGVDPTNGAPQYAAYEEMSQEDWNKLTDEEKAEYVSYDGKEAKYIVNSTDGASLRQIGKSALPSFTGGLSTTVQAFGFDLSIQTAFSFGGWTLDYTYAELLNSGLDGGQNYHKDIFRRWTPNNTITDIPALFYGNQSQGIDATSDFFLTRSNYFSLRNITLGYTIPSKLTKKLGIEKIRVYLVGDNIWLKSARKGLDPRQYISGETGNGYSALSSYSFGLNISL